MKKPKKGTDEKRGNLSHTAQVCSFLITQALMILAWPYKMVILLVVPIFANIFFGTFDLLQIGAKKKWLPEKVWQGVVLFTLVVEMIISAVEVFQVDKGDFLMDVVVFPIVGLIAYAILTGQGYLTYKGNPSKKKTGRWNAGMEYVVDANLYRDKNGNYYNLQGAPVAPPVKIKK